MGLNGPGSGLGIVTLGLENDENVSALQAPTAALITAVALNTTTIRIEIITAAARAAEYKAYWKVTGGSYAQFPDGSTTHLTSTIDITGLTASTDYMVKIAGSNPTGDTDSNEVTVSTPAATPILSRIEAAMLALIEGMTIAGGYYYDWGDCNERDMAIKDAYPNAEIYLSDEENDDDINGDHSNAYENRATFEIRVHGKLSAIQDNPEFSINAEHNKALDDLKKLFGTNYTVSDTCNTILYRGSRREKANHGDVLVPTILITTWEISYAQDRQSVANNAN